MSILVYCEPIGALIPYDPTFKVEDCLDDPLRVGQIDTNSITLSIVVTVSQLELLCKKELAQKKTARIEHGQYSNSFESKAMVLRKNATAYFEKLPHARFSLMDFLSQIGAAQLYPRALAYLKSPENATFPENQTVMDGYFSSVAQLHQLLSLCHQLQDDLGVFENHKYIAHQLAVLFQLLNNISCYEPLVTVKEEIANNFQQIKESIISREENTRPVLSDEWRLWLVSVTRKISEIVSTFPTELTESWWAPANVASGLPR